MTVRVKAARAVGQASLSRLRPLQDDQFEWPTLESIQEAQASAENPGSGFEKDEQFLLPVIQSNLSQTPVRSLMGKSAMEVFTGLDREPIVNVVLKP
ncbi:unnamed protein product [Phytophthora fragariaefolia]|uniref:Unnamed protein product n=1 Tax=Phytophthora fragariaefolia TaxID=1490495 RepID=A0A9W6XWN8_9STRA|nr:unnamed protein product [Phytophthora fragariaefolia]